MPWTDTNECADGSHECGEHGVCSNTHGSYDCSCEGGYEVDEIGRICHGVSLCKNKFSVKINKTVMMYQF